jgi:hypothetical protein
MERQGANNPGMAENHPEIDKSRETIYGASVRAASVAPRGECKWPTHPHVAKATGRSAVSARGSNHGGKDQPWRGTHGRNSWRNDH